MVDWPASVTAVVSIARQQRDQLHGGSCRVCRSVEISEAPMAVGFPIAGRSDPALDNLVGLSTPWWVDRLASQLRQLLGQVRASRAAYENQDVPSRCLLTPEPTSSSPDPSPKTQVMLAW